MSIREDGFEAADLWRADIEQSWSVVARLAVACASCFRRGPAAIHVSAVSEQWLTAHAAETPKHADAA